MTNVYTGNYAYGSRGTAVNTKTGASVAGGKVTVGNAYTGKSTTVGGVTASRPGEPPRSVVGAKGENGGVIAVGGPGDKQVYGTKDGEVYRRTGNGQWEQATPPSGNNKPMPTSSSNRPDRPSQLPAGAAALPPPGNYQDLDRQRQARDMGNQRAGSFQRSRPAGGFHGGGGRRR